MARLPQPGGDNGNWGQILNDYLTQSHNGDGTLKPIAQSVITNLQADLAAKANTSSLALVATSGSYVDLTSKPSMPDINASGLASNPVTSAAAARPTGLTVVYWRCATQPTNWQPNDIWFKV